jgi:S-DNA-T family DNA segregation ATPase FtsK/SpoIIIE
LKKAFFLFLFAVVLYLTVSTLFPKKELVGIFGEFIGRGNFELFGFLSIVFDGLLFYILYLFYKDKFDTKTSLKMLGIIIIFLDMLFLQALILKIGVIGELFVNTLKGYVGVIGVVILILIFAAWGGFLIWQEEIMNFEFFKLKQKQIIEIKKEQEEKVNASKEVKEVEIKQQLNTEPSNKEEIIKESLNKIKKYDEVFPELDEEDIHVNNDKKDLNITIEQQNEDKKEVEEIKPSSNEIEEAKEIKIEENEKEVLEIEEILEENENQEEKEIKEKNEKVQKVEVLEDTKKLLSEIEVGEREKPKDWKFPPLDILQAPPVKKREINEAEIDKKIKTLLEKLRYFKIEGDVVRYYVGPVVTTFEFKPLPHIKVSKILSLQDDLAMALKAKSIRIQAPIPGKDVVGIEIPNDEPETIYLREILESEIFQKAKSPLTIALGKDVVGQPFVTDLAKLPHLLIAGTTGSGKSVGINSMILSLLYRNSPDELKFVMVDPKQLEFSIYNDIPHLLTPVITEPKKAITALNAMVKEMERRYKLMAEAKVKNIESYNKKSGDKLPYIVIIIDELADLMMTSGKDVEYAIARLAQMARASGIHLIVATQRPSVDVVTGLIKANLPSRISFKVGQKIDSKVILDQYGAETLLGRGDMLFTPPGITGLLRLHAPFATEEEIEEVVEFLKSQRAPEYDESIINTVESEDIEEVEDLDPLFEEAKEIILKERRTSISYLQRRLQIGYNRAANIIEQMERMGILSPANARGQREILI